MSHVNDVRPEGSGHINKMSQAEATHSQTQKLINYNAINDATMHKLYRTARVRPEGSAEEQPLKKFHQYFGKIQPSLYQELKNIFQNSSFEQRAASPQADYHIQGTTVGPRGRQMQLRSRERKELTPIGNHFTIESLNSRSLYRKAKLNRLILCHQALQADIPQEQAKVLLRESGELVSELQTSLGKQGATRHNSTQRSFRVTRASVQRQSFLQILNPTNRERFTQVDLNQALCLLHRLDIQISPNISYFNVYVQEGNNAELLKSLVRKRSGWRVVEIPAIANLIWTQFYRKAVLKKRLHKREKSETEEDKEKMIVRADNFKRMRALTINNNSRYDSITRGGEYSPSKSSESEAYSLEVRKLMAGNEAQEMGRMRRWQRKAFHSLQISHNVLVHNHFPNNACISDKKNLLANLTQYLQANKRNVFQIVPQSFELNDLNHPIVETLQQPSKDHWIIKPGENSNRGRGITVAHSGPEAIEELKRRLNDQVEERESITQRRKRKSVILQRYIKPLLYCGRKFDIRSYMLVTFLNDQLRMYCYEECYIRTSSKPFDIDSTNRLVHLTNDAVQAHSADYGKFEEGNKVAETIFSKFIDEQHKRRNPSSNGVWQDIKTEMQNRCIDVIESSYENLLKGARPAPESGEQQQEIYYFQLFGMDFMIDEDFGLWLIEVNTNPAITHDCSRVLNRLIPRMLDNAFAVAIDPVMRPFRLPDVPYTNQFTAAFKKVIN